MKVRTPVAGMLGFLILAACGTNGSSGAATTGGTTSSGGQPAGGSGGTGGVTSGSGGTGAGGSTVSSGGGTASGGVTGSGGTTATGGVTGSGGTTSTGGRSATGGTVTAGSGGTSSTGTGGATGSGGTTTTGGVTGSGGTTTTGGVTGSGGTTSTGGVTGSGGTRATGGATGSGGTIGSGGITSAGPLATYCPNAIPAGIVAEWCSCDQWGELHKAEITYYNDIWGSAPGPQCIWVAGDKWGVAANHPTSSDFVQSYPNISYSPGKAISAYSTYTSSFDITVPSSGRWEMAYDIWVQNSSSQQVEIMLWMNYTKGSVFPAGSLGKSGVSTGGHTWDVYYGAYGGHDVVSLLRTSNVTSGTVEVKAILDWIIANKGNFQSNWTLYQVQFGPEIVANSGVQSFVINSFSVSSS
jgi:hypothetical protein